MTHRASLALATLAACHATPSTPTSINTVQACAPALPALAKQHGKNQTRLYLATMHRAGDTITVDTPVLATQKRGYVNQPAFTADGTGLYFTWRDEGGQADIWYRDLANDRERAITCTSEEEYGVTPTRDGVVAIRVEADGSRHLARIDATGTVREQLFPAIADPGAFVWLDDRSAVLFFATAEGTRLELGDPQTGATRVIARNTSAAVSAIPNARAISYVDQSGERPRLVRYALDTGEATPIGELPDNVEKLAWLADGSVLVGNDKRIRRLAAGASNWVDIARLDGAIDGSITRVVASGDHLAIVVRID